MERCFSGHRPSHLEANLVESLGKLLAGAVLLTISRIVTRSVDHAREPEYIDRSQKAREIAHEQIIFLNLSSQPLL
jgi:hypothetical protein